MTPDNFLDLWGKTDRTPNADPNNYHPLLFHLYDVAYCAALLWEMLPVNIKVRMANALEMEIRSVGTLFVLLCGLHDLGKAYPNFQNKADQFLPELQTSGFDFPADIGNHPHNFVSVPEVQRLLTGERLFSSPLPLELSRIFAYTLGAHHGVFPHADDLSSIRGRVLGENQVWQQARDWLADQLVIGIPNIESSAPPADVSTIKDRAFAPLLAALISLADWFGSSKYFEMRGAQDIGTYRVISQKSAAEALQKSGWTEPPISPVASNFTQLFAYLDRSKTIEPNALQKQVATLLEEVHTPALWMIEEEMGAGKTEAAFSIFDNARVHQRTHGIYVAMPTQATSNAMFDRLSDFLKYRNPHEVINLVLAHSHATLAPEYLERMRIAENFTSPVYNEETGEEEGALLVRSWFTQSKQALLAPYGVGTIDQALLGVLQTRHWFVRLFGLASKVVIFDEVHAYDAYMNTLLSRLIEWLAELDCTVVLLSATLPKSTRLKLADAYAKGAKARLESTGNQVAYPRITLIEKGKSESARAVKIDKEKESEKEPKTESKRVALSHLPNRPEAVRAALFDAIPGDGCAIVICNTVANAQEMYEALKAHLAPLEWECLLFHARTPFKWRKEKEDRVLELFGKKSGNDRTTPRRKTLLVATQVAEQSLDLDADFMASELAPIDLILQRMGRLYRHIRARMTAEPRFALLYNLDKNAGLPNVGMSAEIYALHTLLRSWLTLKDRTEIVLPDDIEDLVSEVYDQSDPTGLPDAWIQRLTDAYLCLQNDIMNAENIAESVIVNEPCAPRYLFNQDNRKLSEEDNPKIDLAIRAATRLSEPTVRVICIGTDKNGKALAPNLDHPDTPKEVRSLMEFEISIASRGLVNAILKTSPPAGWKKKAHLRYHYPLYFERGIAKVGCDGLTLELDAEIGLREEKSQ